MRATNWVRKETAAARKVQVRIEAQATIGNSGTPDVAYGVCVRFHATGQPSRKGERLAMYGTIEDARELLAKLTEAIADAEHYRAEMSHTRTPRG